MSIRTLSVASIRASALLPGDLIMHPSRGHTIVVAAVVRADDTVTVEIKGESSLKLSRGSLVSLRA